MASYTEQLKLAFDPFDSTIEAAYFYPGGERQSVLDRLLELCRFGSDVGLVSGSLGSGKSTLAHWLTLSLDDDFVPVKVAATLFMSEAEFLEAICTQLNINTGAASSAAELTSLVEDYASSLNSRARTLILIVDDAHELGEAVLQSLVDLMATQRDTAGLGEDGVKAILFGEPLLRGTLDKLLPSGGADFELMPLTAEEIDDYIDFKLSTAGYRGKLPIHMDELALIHARSNGIPGAIDALVRAELDRPLDVARTLPSLNFPERHLVAASVLFAVFVIALFLMLGGGPDDPVEQPIASTAPATTGRVQVPVALNTQAESPATPDASQTTTGTPVEEQPVVTRQMEESVPQVVIATEPAPAAAVVADTPQAIEADAEEQSAEEQPAQAETTEAAATQVAAVTAVESASPLVLAQDADRITSGQRLLSVEPRGYTLQLLGSHSEDNVRNFITSNSSAGDLVYFESRYQDRPWYVVVYGTFPSRTVAREAIDGLPQPIRELQPWARPLADVQADLSRYQ